MTKRRQASVSQELAAALCRVDWLIKSGNVEKVHWVYKVWFRFGKDQVGGLLLAGMQYFVLILRPQDQGLRLFYRPNPYVLSFVLLSTCCIRTSPVLPIGTPTLFL